MPKILSTPKISNVWEVNIGVQCNHKTRLKTQRAGKGDHERKERFLRPVSYFGR